LRKSELQNIDTTRHKKKHKQAEHKRQNKKANKQKLKTSKPYQSILGQNN